MTKADTKQDWDLATYRRNYDRLMELAQGLRDERDTFAEVIRDPAKLLNHLLDTKGVEPWYGYSWRGDDLEHLPACIYIPRELSRQVFGARDSEQSDEPQEPSRPSQINSSGPGFSSTSEPGDNANREED